MRKIVSLFSILALVCIVITGCNKQVDEKLCRIEIADSNHNIVAKLENQSQSDVTGFFDESDWKETNISTDNLIPEYIISVYQEKTKTVIQTENAGEYEKIMEYVTFENTDVIKVSIGGDVVGDIVSDDILDEYYTASSDFFSKIKAAVSIETA